MDKVEKEESLLDLTEAIEALLERAESDPYRDVRFQDMVPVFRIAITLGRRAAMDEPQVEEEVVEMPELDPE